MSSIDAAGFDSNKIVNLNLAAKKISEFKKANKTLGLCHGGFDLLHPGHIKHLESAAKLCDYLFVSITSDKYVAARKGSNRPVFSERLRAYSVASLSYVNYVIISNFERATEIVDKLRPSYYIKGPDFINKTTPGISDEKNKIEALGGKIKFTTDHKFSTTEIIKHIKENVKRKKILLGIDRDGTLIEDIEFLGKEENWKEQIKLKKDVIDLLIYLQTKYDTVKIVVSNQQGVARNYFDKERVEEINKYTDKLLGENGIITDDWRFCTDVDKKYAVSIKEAKFNPDFVKEKTKRKPSPDMILDALSEINKSIDEFEKILIIGNSQDDKELAKNINAQFIDVNNKNYDELKKEFEKV